MRQLVQIQRAQHVLDRRHAIDQPRVLIAAHDLLLIIRAHQIAHDGAHHIVERDHAHDAAVLVHDHGKVFMHLAELLQHLGQRQPIGNDEHLVHQLIVVERQRLVVEHALEEILGVDIANHVIDIALAHRVGRERLLCDARTHHRIGVIAQEERDPLALRHRGRHHARVQLEHVGNHLLLTRFQHARTGAGLGQRKDVVGRDAVIALGGQTQQFDELIGGTRVKPDDRLEQRHRPQHRLEQARRPDLRLRHPEPLRNQIGKHDEQRRHDDERAQKSEGLRTGRRQPMRVQLAQCRAQRTFTDDAAQNGDGVQADLHHGEVVPGLLLQLQHLGRPNIPLIRHLRQPQTPRSCERKLGQRKKGAEHDQQSDDEKAFGQLHTGFVPCNLRSKRSNGVVITQCSCRQVLIVDMPELLSGCDRLLAWQ